MSGPDRIYLQDAGDYASAAEFEVTWCVDPQDDGDTEYIRRDPAVLAAMPEVQALIAGAYEAAANEGAGRAAACGVSEISGIVRLHIRALIPADAIAARDAMIAEAVAKEREACAQMFGPIVAAAIRKRGEGQP